MTLYQPLRIFNHGSTWIMDHGSWHIPTTLHRSPKCRCLHSQFRWCSHVCRGRCLPTIRMRKKFVMSKSCVGLWWEKIVNAKHLREIQMLLDKCGAPPKSDYIKETLLHFESVGWWINEINLRERDLLYIVSYLFCEYIFVISSIALDFVMSISNKSVVT